MGAIGTSPCFFFKKSSKAIRFLLRLFSELKRLFKLAGVKELVKELYDLLGPQFNYTHAGAYKPLFDNRNALLELGAILLKLLVGKDVCLALAGWKERADSTKAASPTRNKCRVV